MSEQSLRMLVSVFPNLCSWTLLAIQDFSVAEKMALSDTTTQSANAAVLHKDQGNSQKCETYTALLASRQLPLENVLNEYGYVAVAKFKAYFEAGKLSKSTILLLGLVVKLA